MATLTIRQLLPVRFSKNSVGGRYLATFSCNSFGIIRKLVAELVAAGILVALQTPRPQATGNRQQEPKPKREEERNREQVTEELPLALGQNQHQNQTSRHAATLLQPA